MTQLQSILNYNTFKFLILEINEGGLQFLIVKWEENQLNLKFDIIFNILLFIKLINPFMLRVAYERHR